jgi:hypothetical protein
LVTADDGLRFCLFGENKARAATYRLLKANSSPKKSLTFMTTLATRAIKAGINKTSPRPDGGSETACGGKIFTKPTRYK